MRFILLSIMMLWPLFAVSKHPEITLPIERQSVPRFMVDVIGDSEHCNGVIVSNVSQVPYAVLTTADCASGATSVYVDAWDETFPIQHSKVSGHYGALWLSTSTKGMHFSNLWSGSLAGFQHYNTVTIEPYRDDSKVEKSSLYFPATLASFPDKLKWRLNELEDLGYQDQYQVPSERFRLLANTEYNTTRLLAGTPVVSRVCRSGLETPLQLVGLSPTAKSNPQAIDVISLYEPLVNGPLREDVADLLISPYPMASPIHIYHGSYSLPSSDGSFAAPYDVEQLRKPSSGEVLLHNRIIRLKGPLIIPSPKALLQLHPLAQQIAFKVSTAKQAELFKQRLNDADFWEDWLTSISLENVRMVWRTRDLLGELHGTMTRRYDINNRFEDLVQIMDAIAMEDREELRNGVMQLTRQQWTDAQLAVPDPNGRNDFAFEQHVDASLMISFFEAMRTVLGVVQQDERRFRVLFRNLHRDYRQLFLNYPDETDAQIYERFNRDIWWGTHARRFETFINTFHAPNTNRAARTVNLRRNYLGILPGMEVDVVYRREAAGEVVAFHDGGLRLAPPPRLHRANEFPDHPWIPGNEPPPMPPAPPRPGNGALIGGGLVAFAFVRACPAA